MNSYVAYLLPLIVSMIILIPFLQSERNEGFIIDLKPLKKKLSQEKIQKEQKIRKEILKRACEVVGDLNQFSKNGTSKGIS